MPLWSPGNSSTGVFSTVRCVPFTALGYVDAGKTTLSEGILYLSGVVRKLGRVDHRDAFLDTDAQERERGITIFAKQAEFSWGETATGKFVNRGFLNGPVCPIYGFGVVIVLSCLTPLADNLLILFLGSVLLTWMKKLVMGILAHVDAGKTTLSEGILYLSGVVRKLVQL